MDWDLAASVLPRKVVEMLKYFKVDYFDMKKWTRDYEPSISSIFMFGEGGSYDFEDENWGPVDIHNGTLACVGGSSMDSYSQKYEKAFNRQNYPKARKEDNPPKIPEIPDLNLSKDFEQHWLDSFANFNHRKEKYRVPAILSAIEEDLKSYVEKTGKTIDDGALTAKKILYVIGYLLTNACHFWKNESDSDEESESEENKIGNKPVEWSMLHMCHVEKLLKFKYGTKYDGIFEKFHKMIPENPKDVVMFLKRDYTFCSEDTILKIINGHPSSFGSMMTCDISRNMPLLLRLLYEDGYLNQ